ncbi:YggT family protein [Candidatus Wolfebacteria bacterium]|nr:YggT family protein [Candidatus Wolfebacteria bacterium]
MDLQNNQNANKYHFWSLIIKYTNGFLELLLLIRVILKFLNASSEAPIVKLIYFISNFLIAPFKSIFSNIYLNNNMLDMVAISAIAGYLILTLIILKFLQIIFLRRNM